MHILPELNIMLVVLVVFLVTMYAMNRFVFVPLINFMDRRNEKIDSDQKNIDAGLDEISIIEAEIESVLMEAKVKAHQIIDEQAREAKHKAKLGLDNIRNENKVKLDNHIVQLNSMRDAMRQDIVSHIGEFRDLIDSRIKG